MSAVLERSATHDMEGPKIRVLRLLTAFVVVAMLALNVFPGATFRDSRAAAPGLAIAASGLAVDSDADLMAAAAANHWTGSGTQSDPWVISSVSGTNAIDMRQGSVGLRIANISTRYFVVRDLTISNSSIGDAVDISDVNTPFQVSRLTVSDVRNGIVVNRAASGSAIRDVNVHGVVNDGIRVENSTQFFVENNSVSGAYYAIRTIYCTNSYVRDNVVFDGQGDIYMTQFVAGIVLTRTAWTIVSDNEIYDINVAVMPEWGSNNTFEGNYIHFCAQGFYLDQASAYNIVRHNEIVDMTEDAVSLNYDATGTGVFDNVISNCSWSGVYVARSPYANITGNAITESAVGIRLVARSESVRIAGNLVDKCGIGISVDSSNYSIIADNHIANSSGQGLLLVGGQGHSVQGNLIEDCAGYGIESRSAASSAFQLNVILGNHGSTGTRDSAHVQAYDTTASNSWDSGTVGNYWSDWTTPDVNRDSIVDAYYVLDGVGAKDRHALTYTVGMVNRLQSTVSSLETVLTWQEQNYSAGGPLLGYEVARGGVLLAFLGPDVYGFSDATVTPGRSYTYSLVAVNGNGRSGERSLTVTVPPLNYPQVRITAPSEGALLGSSSVSVTWVGSGSGRPITGYAYKMNDRSWVNCGLVTHHTFSSAEGVVEGANTVQVRITNLAGQTSTSTVHFIVDVTPPTIVIDSPPQGLVQTNGRVDVSWHGSDANGIARYLLRLNGGEWQDEGKNGAAALELADGESTISVMAVDDAGNSRTASVIIMIDTVGPKITEIDPMGGSVVKATRVAFTWKMADDGVGLNHSEVSVDGAAFINIKLNQSYLTPPLANGWHTLELKAFDNAGLNTSVTVQFSVETEAPSVAIVAPSEASMCTELPVELVWTASATAVALAEYRAGSGEWISIPTTGRANVSLPDGSYALHLRIFDDVGRIAEDQVNVTVDVAPPMVSQHSPEGAADIDSSITAVFSKEMDHATVRFVVNGETVSPTFWNGNVASYAPASLLPYATGFTVVVSGKDLAGHDLTGPSSTFTFETKCLVSGTVKDENGNPVSGATVYLRQGASTAGTGVTSASGVFSIAVPAGTYTITVSAQAMKDHSSQVTVLLGQSNFLETVTMQPQDDLMPLFIIAPIVVICLAVAFLLVKRKR